MFFVWKTGIRLGKIHPCSDIYLEGRSPGIKYTSDIWIRSLSIALCIWANIIKTMIA